MKYNLVKNNLIFFVIILFIFSAITPITLGYNVKILNKQMIIVDDYDCYHRSEISRKERYSAQREYPNYDKLVNSEVVTNLNGSPKPLDGPIDSPWPMYCHDTRHTGRSPYSTTDTWDEVWMFKTWGPVEGGPAIADDETIYAGAYPLYAFYSNGTEKWMVELDGWIESCPAIGEDGKVYVGTTGGSGNYIYGINPNGTVKWVYPTSDIYSSPAIGDDGTIYFGDSDNWYIKALYPNGTLKWAYKTDLVVYSSPAIGPDGTVYCGSHDTYLYALYPNNGSLKWKYKTGDWIRTSPCIADDGTIYCVSLDNYLYAIYPNGTMKWRTNVGAGTSPTIAQDGTIYCGYNKLYAINPVNGSVKWTFDVGGAIRGGTPCNSVDGTIYLGTHIGAYDDGEVMAVNPDGTLKWRKRTGTVESPPAVGADGTVYIGSGAGTKGYLHAFGIGPLEADADGPYYGLINQPVQFVGSATGGYRSYDWFWNFGDDQTSDEQNPIHTYINQGNYTVTLTVTDNKGNTSTDTTWAKIKESNNPPNTPSITGPTKGKSGHTYDYNFITIDPDNDESLNYYIDWGDNSNSGWIGPYVPGQDVTLSHTWNQQGTYIIKAKAKDNYGSESEWGTLSVTMPLNLQMSKSNNDQQINMQSSNPLFLKMMQLLLEIR